MNEQERSANGRSATCGGNFLNSNHSSGGLMTTANFLSASMNNYGARYFDD